MYRVISLSVVAGVIALGVWAIARRLRRRQHGNDLGTISDAWLHDKRSFRQQEE
jgi:hypothetical protein